MRWYELPFDEGVLMGWIGQYSSGALPLESFREHLKTYAPKIYKFYGLDDASGPQAVRAFDDTSVTLEVLARFSERSRVLKKFDISDDQLHIELCDDHLQSEVAFLKNQGIQRIVALTEHHHNRDVLRDHFQLNHIAINDLGAPQLEQAKELAELIQQAKQQSEKLAVHCLAGIGRTSTMLIAAHMLLGETYDDLKTRINERNPSYGFAGSQGEFLKALRDSRR